MNADRSAFEPVAAGGQGAEVFSLPELFYLTNAKLIDEWANLKRAALASQDTWLIEHVSPAIAELAEGCGLEHVQVTSGRWRSSLLVLAGTPTTIERPLTGIGIGWSAADLSAPYVGVSLDVRSDAKAAIAEALAVESVRVIAQAAGYQSEAGWPAWRYVARAEQWWSDLDDTQERLTGAVAAAYELFHQVLADALTRLSGSAGAAGSHGS